MRIFRWLALPAFAALTAAVACAADANSTAYLFTYFVKNGADGLHLAWSADGYKWEALNSGASYLPPRVGKSKLMRDPCVACGPDGTYRMVWTSGWWENNIGYASTRDFITWSEEREIPVMAHEPAVRNCWAPEVFWDAKRGEFLLFWSSTIPERFPATRGSSEDQLNHRLYATTTRDFAAFTPTRFYYDPGFCVIDATVFAAGGRFGLIVKDETKFPVPRKHLRLALGDDPEGPWGELTAPFTPAGVWAEGPTAIKIGGDYLVYFDAYQQGHYAGLRSRDLVTWEEVTARMTFPNEGGPQRMRHGTVIAVPAALVDRLRAISVVAAP